MKYNKIKARAKFEAENPNVNTKKKFLITFNENQMNMMSILLTKYGQTSRTALFSLLMSNDLNKRTVGRPAMIKDIDENNIQYEPDFSNDLPKNIYYAGKMIGKREMKYLETKQENFPQSQL